MTKRFWRRHTLPGAATLALAMTTCATQPQPAKPDVRPPAAGASRLDMVAAALEKSPGRLQLLEAEVLALAFVEGSYETYTVRDLETGETLELSLDLSTNARIDPAVLRSRDRELAGVIKGKLEPRLFELLLAHPELETVTVLLVFNPKAVRESDGRPPMDWLEPEMRERFDKALTQELRDRGVEASINLRTDFPSARVSLSAHELAALAGSGLIGSVSLAAPADIID